MRCPVCWSSKTLIVLSRTSTGRCDECGSTWVCSGGQAIRVKRPVGSKTVVQPQWYEAVR